MADTADPTPALEPHGPNAGLPTLLCCEKEYEPNPFGGYNADARQVGADVVVSCPECLRDLAWVPVAGGSVQPAEPECAACGHAETLHGTEEGCVGLLDDGAQHCWCRGYKNAADVESLIAGCDPEKEALRVTPEMVELEALARVLAEVWHAPSGTAWGDLLPSQQEQFREDARKVRVALAGCADTTEPELPRTIGRGPRVSVPSVDPPDPTREQIRQVHDKWAEIADQRKARGKGFDYEQGYRNALAWVLGMDPNGDTNG